MIIGPHLFELPFVLHFSIKNKHKSFHMSGPSHSELGAGVKQEQEPFDNYVLYLLKAANFFADCC